MLSPTCTLLHVVVSSWSMPERRYAPSEIEGYVSAVSL